jgi:hypothetical protein
MSNDERDKLMLFLIERHEEVMAELGFLKDAQLRMNTQIEILNKVAFGLAQQINELVSKLEREGILKNEKEEDWLTGIPRMPQKDKKDKEEDQQRDMLGLPRKFK